MNISLLNSEKCECCIIHNAKELWGVLYIMKKTKVDNSCTAAKDSKTTGDNVFKRLRVEYNHSVDVSKNELTQVAIAKEMGVTRSKISHLESGDYRPTLDDYIYYHNKFGVTIEYLLGETASKKLSNINAGRDLGITDAAADTLRIIKNRSIKDDNLSAVVSAFLGNREATMCFFDQIFSYLLSEHVNGKNPTVDALMISEIVNYIEFYVRPALTEVLERKKHYDEKMHEVLFDSLKSDSTKQ